MTNLTLIGKPAYTYIPGYESDEFTADEQDYNPNPITITVYDRNEELDAQVIGLSDGTWWFSDENETIRIARRINIGYIKFDPDRGYVYRNGRNIKEFG